jgi:hypothetical protein
MKIVKRIIDPEIKAESHPKASNVVRPTRRVRVILENGEIWDTRFIAFGDVTPESVDKAWVEKRELWIRHDPLKKEAF